ncbi:site-specific tyrosine recombinase XerD [Kordia sp. SMS9]|uniref:site-specific integrase n=1 Tax=Kordia sp. SMS9 TaxID=2282170 RepID=UPI000E0D3D08|nr:site-specific integrase [Kordia sp. SMS9]AXG69630.1 site-specific tyrosine recombinase XerD [Kordia sp. SMS9]
MASSIKITLRNKQNKDGLFPIAIRITKNRKSTFIYTGHYIDKKHWDSKKANVKKSHPNSVRLNNLIASKLAEAHKTLIDLQANDNVISSKQIKNQIASPINNKSFNEVAKEYIEELKTNNKLTRMTSDQVRINHVIEFSKSNDLQFREIDEDFLRRFMSFLKAKKSNSQRSVVNALVVIRTLYNRAIKMGVIERKFYPFGRDKIKIKYPETEKIGLSVSEVEALETLDNLTPQEQHTLNIWLFSFYLAGMRVADVLKIRWSDIYDDRLHYRMNKNEKVLSLKLPKKLFPILKSYEHDKQNSHDFIFPEMKKANLKNPQDVLAKTKTATKKFNKYLERLAKKAKISKKLTMHIARHTFGNISGDTIPIQTLQRLYRHSSITTTINYQANFIHKDFDEALDKVVNFGK